VVGVTAFVVPTIIVELEDAAKTGPNEETRRAPKTARAATEDFAHVAEPPILL